MKRFLVLLLAGALSGMAFGAWAGPKMISWWFAPPVQNALLTCNREIDWAMQSLVKAQLGAALGGALVFAIGGGLIGYAWRNRAERKAQQAQQPKPQP